jgi:tetratricopeptide (TPR) repeat protein
MSRYPEAEIFAREMVAESEKMSPISGHHVMAVERLVMVLENQDRFEEAHRLAHDAVGRFRAELPEEDAMVRLMEAEASALQRLDRNEEALAIQEYCLKTRVYHPERFPKGGEVPSDCFYSMAQSMKCVGRLEEAEAMFKKALAMLESEGIEFHPTWFGPWARLGTCTS